MKTNYLLFLLLYIYANQSFAWNQGGFDYQVITGNTMPTPGCKSKPKALKQASSNYRIKKSSQVICQNIGYGWGFMEIQDEGEIVCEACDDESLSKENYRCYIKNISLKCRLIRRGW